MKKFLDVAVEAAREAGAILRTEFDRPKEISYKGEVDIVTESDRRSEALIVHALARGISRSRHRRRRRRHGRGSRREI